MGTERRGRITRETAIAAAPNGITVAAGEWHPEGSSPERSVLRHALDAKCCAVDLRLSPLTGRRVSTVVRA